jgi:hypothetical protein
MSITIGASRTVTELTFPIIALNAVVGDFIFVQLWAQFQAATSYYSCQLTKSNSWHAASLVEKFSSLLLRFSFMTCLFTAITISIFYFSVLL